MLPYLAPKLTALWGPFRLFGSYLVLIGIGTGLASFLVWRYLPRYWARLPRDQGKPFVAQGEEAKGKPTGAGFFLVTALIPVVFLVMPFTAKLWQVVGCLYLAMLTGYLDDCSETPWGEALKGGLDFGVALLTGIALCQFEPFTVWWPLLKGSAPDGSFSLPPWVFIPMATVLLWGTINATNCSDGVDGLAGSLTLLSLFYLGGFMYVVIGHMDVARYLLLPHDASGASWSILLFTVAGGLGGYLWHNAKPSAVLMGDAGSRFLGLLVGVSVLAAGNPFLILVMAPVVLVNGGSGLMKLALLRGFRRLGFDVRPPEGTRVNAPETGASGVAANGRDHVLIRLLHKVRFPLHDHCRRNLGWSDPQVLMRFMLLQMLLTPLLLGLLVKLR